MHIFWCLSVLLPFISCQPSSTGLANVLSNYAKVAVNVPENSTMVSSTPSTTLSPNITTTEDDDSDEVEDYDDFDDFTATEQPKSPGIDGQSMMKVVSGLVSLMALMAQYGEKPKRQRPAETIRGRKAETDPFADSINGLAEAQDRYNPTTATKKFKLNQAGYPPLPQSPVYIAPGSTGDSYSPPGGKTSYDSDISAYKLKPSSGSTFNLNDAITNVKPPMKEYIKQNEPPVDIKQSYSYQIPPESVKPYGGTSQSANDAVNKMKPPMKEQTEQDDPQFDIKQSYSYQLPSEVVNSKPTKNMDIKSSYYMPAAMNLKKPVMSDLPPDSWNKMKLMEAHDEHDNYNDIKPPGPVYRGKNPRPHSQSLDYVDDPHDHGHYPWQSPPKSKPVPPTDYDDTPAISSWAMKAPKPMDEVDDSDDHHDLPPWEIKPQKGAHDDHVYRYPYSEHDHGVLYPGDDDHHHEEEEEHDLKDEDRESKRPYTYYHLGRKLWYVPLLFSLYFIIYIGSLLLKSIARHKVQFPEKLWDVHDHHGHHGHDRQGRTLDSVTESVLSGIEKSENKYM